MQSLIEKISKFNDQLGRWAAWLSLAMVLLMFTIVVLRYAFQLGSIAMQELVMYLNALIFTLGAAYTLKEQGHVRVDVFYNQFSKATRSWVDILGSLIFLLVTCGFVIWASWDYVAVSWRIREGSAESSGLQYVYLLKTCLLLLPTLLALQGIAELFRSIQSLKDTSEDLSESGGSHP
ncbi:MAG: TRAP transporter small permease subunit [Pseudomonadota bacterium]